MPAYSFALAGAAAGSGMQNQPSRSALPTHGCWISRLLLSSFRSYGALELELAPCPGVLLGPNGAGKTNLLEALSLFAPGRGLRGARLGELARREEGQPSERQETPPRWAVSLDLEGPQGRRQLGTGLDPAAEERRQVHIDGAPQRGQSKLAEVLSLVWLTPQMDGLFREGASERRRFLDRLVSAHDPSHGSRVNAYDYALRERQRLFREGISDADWLTSLEDSLARHGVALAAARRAAVARLDAAAAEGVGPFPAAALELDCSLDGWLAEAPALAVEDRMKAALAAARRRDRESGTTELGPHRSDLCVQLREKALPAALGSTGEQKALLISLILAHARLLKAARGQGPLLLLDEVAAHLDADRRAALFAEVLALESQAWLTGTDASDFVGLQGATQTICLADSRILSHARPLNDQPPAGGGTS